MGEPIKIPARRIHGTTSDSISRCLELAGFIVDTVVIYLPHKRENGVFWIALVKDTNKEPLAIHGRDVGSKCVRHGMVLTPHDGNLWHANPNPHKPVREPVNEPEPNSLRWEAEPLCERLQRILGVLLANECITKTMADIVQQRIDKKRRSYR